MLCGRARNGDVSKRVQKSKHIDDTEQPDFESRYKLVVPSSILEYL
jgi:hypothetical protein